VEDVAVPLTGDLALAKGISGRGQGSVTEGEHCFRHFFGAAGIRILETTPPWLPVGFATLRTNFPTDLDEEVCAAKREQCFRPQVDRVTFGDGGEVEVNVARLPGTIRGGFQFKL